MTTGDHSPSEYNFESISDELYKFDPGMTEHLQTISTLGKSMNGEGGKDSAMYDAWMRSLNDDWPQLGVRSEVTGRLYLFGNIIDEEIFEKAVTAWGEPTRKEGQTYWNVAKAELISCGIVDDADDSTVRLVCAYTFEDDVVPSFTTRPDEYSATYDLLTREGGEQYLRREWPEIIETIERLLPDNSFDTEALLALARTVTDEYQDVLFAHEKLRHTLSEYITYRSHFSHNAPYAMVLEGPLHYVDENDERSILRVPEKSLQYVYRPAIVFQDDGNKTVVTVVATEGEGSDNDTLVIIPSRTIHEFRPTYTGVSLMDRIGSVGDFHAGSDSVELENDELPPRQARLDELRSIQMGILVMIDYARQIANETCESPEEALEMAQSILPSIQAVASGISISKYRLRVEGETIMIPPLDYDIKASDNHDSINIKPLGSTHSMDLGDYQVGYFADIAGSYQPISDEDGRDAFRPIASLQLWLPPDEVELGFVYGVIVASARINSFARVPLDRSTVVIERLDIEETIESTLEYLNESGEGEMVDLLEVVYAQVFDSDKEQMDDEAINALRRLATYCEGTSTEAVRKSILVVLDGIMTGQSLALNTGDDPNELVAGKIIDVKFDHDLDSVAFALSAYDESLHVVTAHRLNTVVLRRDV